MHIQRANTSPVTLNPDVVRQTRDKDGLGGAAQTVAGHAVVSASSGVLHTDQHQGVVTVLVRYDHAGVTVVKNIVLLGN